MSDQEFAPIDGALQENETRFRLLLDTLPFIAFIIAPGGHARYYNRPFIEYHGLVPGDDKVSRTLLLHPADQSRLVSTRQAGAATRGEYIVEARLRRHDGVYRWHRIHNKPLILSGDLAAWLGTAVDIHDVVHANEILEQRVSERTAELEVLNQHLTTEIEQRKRTEEGLRASEARYRRLYNRTPMALHSTSTDARLIDVNDTWLAMFEYEREEVIGRSPADFMTPESAERYRDRSWPEMLASGGALRVVDYQFLTRSGRVFDGRLAAAGEFDAEGRFVRTWSATADVTAEKRADRDLRQAQRMEAVGQLTAGIAHDFNNLLTAILGNLELLAKKPARCQATDRSRAERLIAGAKSAAERGAKLTAQLLAFSRQQRIAAEPVDLNRVIQEMEPLLRSTIGGKIGINIQTDVALSAALADPAQLELAILNLVINARDAMPNGGAITIEMANVVLGEPAWAEEPAAGGYVAVRVSDTGAGIPDPVRERMFEPFFTTKGVGKGSGLGLAQVLGLVKQLGGGLAVRSAPGEGACIAIFLPRADRAAAAEADAPSAHGAVEALPRRRARILLVDDDADVRSIAAAMLSDAGYEVIEASSGASALDTLERADSPTELVLADIAMPGINGVEFAAIVRRTWPALPVLLMTGYADSALLREGGAEHDVLHKPFGAAELEQVMEKVIDRSRVARG
ncbi:MAG: PAS domain S-box protein [Rhodopila sp.]|jgi:PAS domain S-box-containing protein